MKKLFFLVLISILSLGLFTQTSEKKIEVIPTISGSGDGDSIALNTELVIASKFRLNKNWNIYGQLGTMYNTFQNKFAGEKFGEWQLGFEPMVGIGTDHFRISGFLNSLNIKAWDTGKMPFVEGGARFSITPWRKVWVSIFGTWPISHPILVNSLYNEFLFEDAGGVYLTKTTTDKWAEQVKSYGANIDFGIGKKIVLGLDGFATDENNYQVGGGLQYQLFKNKPWILGGNIFYTNFENKDYYYIHNIFPGMLGDDMQGYSFKLGISNYGGLGDLNFSNLLGRIAEPTYYSPVRWKIKKNATKTKINDPFKIDGCTWGGNCLDFQGSLCITSGKAPYSIFVDWGDGTSEQYKVDVAGSLKVNHHYPMAGEYYIIVSGIDGIGKTVSYSGQFTAKNCIPIKNECDNVEMNFSADKDSVNPGKTVNFSWNVNGADLVTFDGKTVAASVAKYPVIFTTLGQFSYTLKAFNDGKICKQETITITVTQCPVAEILSLTVNPTSMQKGGSATVSWVVKNWKTLTLNGVDVAGLTGTDGKGSKKFDNITVATDYVLNAGNDCPSTDTESVKVTVKCEKCTDTSIIISGHNTDTTRTVTLTNNGCSVNSFKIDAEGWLDSTKKTTNSLIVVLGIGETKVITVKYDKNITITFDGVTIIGVGNPACVYYLKITAICLK